MSPLSASDLSSALNIGDTSGYSVDSPLVIALAAAVELSLRFICCTGLPDVIECLGVRAFGADDVHLGHECCSASIEDGSDLLLVLGAELLDLVTDLLFISTLLTNILPILGEHK